MKSDGRRTLYYILNDNGEPVPVLSVHDFWAWRDANHDRVCVAWEQAEGVTVSTVFLGWDACPRQGKPPKLWETLIKTEHGESRKPFETRADAKAFHDRVMAFLRSGGSMCDVWAEERSVAEEMGQFVRTIAAEGFVDEDRLVELVERDRALKEKGLT